MNYVDGFIVPVPIKKVGEYVKLARKVGKIWRELGALEYHECMADHVDLGPKSPFARGVKLKKGETVFFSYIVYKSRKDRDRVNDLVMKDPRVAKLCKVGEMPFDFKRMGWGGFKAKHSC